MEDQSTLEILGIIYRIIQIGLLIVVTVWIYRIVRRASPTVVASKKELRRIVESTQVDDLWQMSNAIKQLKRRNAKYDFSLPILLDHLISGETMERDVAWTALRENFPRLSSSVDFNPISPSTEALDFLKKERMNC